jgi:hypothetical protein
MVARVYLLVTGAVTQAGMPRARRQADPKAQPRR